LALIDKPRAVGDRAVSLARGPMIELPDDENGDVLRRMIARGDDLNRPRIVDFTQIFPTEAAARAFAAKAEAEGLFALVEMTETTEDLPWDVVVEHALAPDHAAITALERRLAEMAEGFGGRADGWGCEVVTGEGPLMRPLR
jgi:hypothetical protein